MESPVERAQTARYCGRRSIAVIGEQPATAMVATRSKPRRL
ncbi:MAG TPA: hypothetical protein VHG92_03010 [Afifellaceae bacterium]|nr:hypothetical protein [Afifellaceae bacterium]